MLVEVPFFAANVTVIVGPAASSWQGPGNVMKLVFQIALGVVLGLVAMAALKLIAGAAIITALLTPTEHAVAFPPAQPAPRYAPIHVVLPDTVIAVRRPNACQGTRPDGTVVYCEGPLTDPK